MFEQPTLDRKRKIEALYPEPSNNNNFVEKRPRIMLTDSSWVDQFRIPDCLALTKTEFEELWNMKPDTRETVKMFGKTFSAPRWSITFGRSYFYAGVKHEAKPLTPVISRLMDWCKMRSPTLNGALVNFYESGLDNIGQHSDNEKSIISESEIYSLSFGATRKMHFHSKKGGPVQETISLEDKTLIVMGGQCQQTHNHSVPLTKQKTGRRINITFRSFQ